MDGFIDNFDTDLFAYGSLSEPDRGLLDPECRSTGPTSSSRHHGVPSSHTIDSDQRSTSETFTKMRSTESVAARSGPNVLGKLKRDGGPFTRVYNKIASIVGQVSQLTTRSNEQERQINMLEKKVQETTSMLQEIATALKQIIEDSHKIQDL